MPRLVFAIFCTFLFAGCTVVSYSERDITADVAATTTWQPGVSYRILQPVLLARHTAAADPIPVLVPPGAHPADLGLPPTLQDYTANPKAWPRVLAIIPSGTHLRLVHIIDHQSLEARRIDYFGLLTDGPSPGILIDLEPLTLPGPRAVPRSPNPHLLRPATPDGRTIQEVRSPTFRLPGPSAVPAARHDEPAGIESSAHRAIG